MLNRIAEKLSPTNFAYLALAWRRSRRSLMPGAAPAACGSGGAVVFSRVVTKTVTETVKDAEGKPVLEVVKDSEGKPIKDKDGNEQTKEVTEKKTTVEGGLFAVKDGRLNQLTEDPTDTEPSFSPDSRAIVFSRGGDIFSVRADGSGLRRVTGGPELDTAPKVAPNGRYVLFERRSKQGAPADLYKVNLNGGATRALATTPDEEHEASFSNDGKLIVFVHSVPETGGGSADDIYSIRPTGAGLTRLTRTGRVDEWHPRYFAGGIVYSRGRTAKGTAPSPTSTRCAATAPRRGRRSPAPARPTSKTSAPTAARCSSGASRASGSNGSATAPPASSRELPDESQTNAVFSSDGKRVAAFIEADERTQLSSISVADGSDRELAKGVVPTETTPTSGTVTTLGPVITWQPSR